MKNFSFIVQCNEQPAMKINVVADTYDKAQAYVKDMYAAQYTTYSDDRFNNWLIKEN